MEFLFQNSLYFCILFLYKGYDFFLFISVSYNISANSLFMHSNSIHVTMEPLETTLFYILLTLLS